MLHKGVGVFRYSRPDGGYKLVVETDQVITDYYRALLPKWIKPNPQRYGMHISVVRRETPINLEAWGKYEGQEVEFLYTHEVFFGAVYCWLNVFCNRLEEVRIKLGLPVSSEYTKPPNGFIKCFHSTIGNFKDA